MQEMWEMGVQFLGGEDPLEGGNGNRLHYSCLENPMDRGAWWATVHRVTKSWTQVKQLSMHAYMEETQETWVTMAETLPLNTIFKLKQKMLG